VIIVSERQIRGTSSRRSRARACNFYSLQQFRAFCIQTDSRAFYRVDLYDGSILSTRRNGFSEWLHCNAITLFIYPSRQIANENVTDKKFNNLVMSDFTNLLQINEKESFLEHEKFVMNFQQTYGRTTILYLMNKKERRRRERIAKYLASGRDVHDH